MEKLDRTTTTVTELDAITGTTGSQTSKTDGQANAIEEKAATLTANQPTKASISRVYRRKQRPLPLDQFFQIYRRTPRAVKAFLIIVLSGVPFAVFMALAATKYSKQDIGPPILHATYFRLSKWLMLSWASLLIIFSLAESLARLGSWVCNLSTHLVKYEGLAKTLCFRITMVAWAGAAHQANCSIWANDETHTFPHNWVATLRKTFEFLIIAFAIILVQGIFLQLIAIRYVEGYIGPRSKKAANELQTIRDLNNLVKPHYEHDSPSFLVKILHKLFWPIQDTIYEAIADGRADDDALKEYAAMIWNSIATTNGSKQTLTASDICSRLKAMGRDPELGEDLFALLDESCDGQVTREELEALVLTTGAQLNKRAASMRGIKRLLQKLEILLTLVVFGIIVFIYTNFFTQTWAKDVKSLWTGILGLSFALGGPVTEFINSCVFVFAKHGYDVGDLVEAKGKKLLVCDIHLTHTNFEELDEEGKMGKVVQISHASLGSEVIVNWTRSQDGKREGC